MAVLDKRRLVFLEAYLNIVQTCFVTIVLAVAAFLFGRDARDLVLTPIERMIAKMHRIRDNPMAAMKLGDEEFRKLEIAKKRESELRQVQGSKLVININ